MKTTNSQSSLPKLLIVDDQAINIRVLHELFRDNCEVFMATSGEQALTKAHALLPDLILLDVVMPGMSGHEVCRQLKADPLLAEIPIIFVTAHYDEADEVRGFELGAVDFIHKPVNAIITRTRVHNQLLLKQLSIGVSTLFPAPNSDAQPLIAQADEQLYKAKNNGRNQISTN